MKTSMISGDDPGRCYLCGRVNQRLEVHHMIHGIRRKHADKYGLTVHLCQRCHMDLHDRGTFDETLKEEAQKAFEERYSHDEWMRIFGKNYRE